MTDRGSSWVDPAAPRGELDQPLQPVTKSDMQGAIDGYIDHRLRLSEEQRTIHNVIENRDPWQLAKSMGLILGVVSTVAGLPVSLTLGYLAVNQWGLVAGRWWIWGLLTWGLVNMFWGAYLAYQLLIAHSPAHTGRYAIRTDAKLIARRDRFGHDENMARIAIDHDIVRGQREYNQLTRQRARDVVRGTPGAIPPPPPSLGPVDEDMGLHDPVVDVVVDFLTDCYTGVVEVNDKGFVSRDTRIPWGKRGGLPKSTRDGITDILSTLGRTGDGWLFRYDRSVRLWQLNVERYTTIDEAVNVVTTVPRRRGGTQ